MIAQDEVKAMAEENPFLLEKIESPELLFVGPHGKQERDNAAKHPDMEFLKQLHDLANYTELFARASASAELGLVNDIAKVEPGYNQHRGRGIDEIML